MSITSASESVKGVILGIVRMAREYRLFGEQAQRDTLYETTEWVPDLILIRAVKNLNCLRQPALRCSINRPNFTFRGTLRVSLARNRDKLEKGFVSRKG